MKDANYMRNLANIDLRIKEVANEILVDCEQMALEGFDGVNVTQFKCALNEEEFSKVIKMLRELGFRLEDVSGWQLNRYYSFKIKW